MGQNSQTTAQNQNQTTNPWAPAIPGLTNIINQLSGGGAPLTGAQSSALSTLQSNASGVPSFGAAGSGAVNNAFGYSNSPQVGLWNSTNNTVQNTLSPYLSSSYTNPMSTPGFGTALNTMNQDITNQVNSEFAAAGRTGSPANSQALARGLSQGEGQLIANQYNANVGQQQNAVNQLYGAGAGTASGTAGLNTGALQAQLSGLQGAGMLPGLYTAPGTTQLQAANIGQQLPYENLQLPASMLGSIASLGGQGTNTGTSTTTQPVNPWTTAVGAGLGLWALSDERLKQDIEPVGLLRSGIPLYSYRFKGDDRPQIGVLAQEVEKVMPDAVVDIGLWRGGPKVKAVDYGRVTAMAA